MDDIESNPSDRVEVELDLGDYISTALTLSDWEMEQWWRDLGDLLYGRAGWSCRITKAGDRVEMLWTFGALGTSLFVVSAGEAPAYHLHDHQSDSDLTFADIDELRNWLDENEQRHADYPRRLRGLAAVSDWTPLRSFPFEVDVAFDGAAWIATFRQLPITYSSGSALSEAVANAREAITDAFDAPRNLAPDLKVVLRLTAEASAAL